MPHSQESVKIVTSDVSRVQGPKLAILVTRQELTSTSMMKCVTSRVLSLHTLTHPLYAQIASHLAMNALGLLTETVYPVIIART